MTFSSYDFLKVERHGPVGWLINNRPDQLNAMNSAMRDEFADAWKASWLRSPRQGVLRAQAHTMSHSIRNGKNVFRLASLRLGDDCCEIQGLAEGSHQVCCMGP